MPPAIRAAGGSAVAMAVIADSNNPLRSLLIFDQGPGGRPSGSIEAGEFAAYERAAMRVLGATARDAEMASHWQATRLRSQALRKGLRAGGEQLPPAPERDETPEPAGAGGALGAKAAKRASREAREAARRAAHEQRMEQEAAEELKQIDEKRQEKEQSKEKKVKKKRRVVQYVPAGSADF